MGKPSSKYVVWLFLLLLSTTVAAQDVVKDLSARGARIFHAKDGSSLTQPSYRGSDEITKGFLRTVGTTRSTTDSLFLTKEDRSSRAGFTHIRFEQEIDGLSVYGTYVKASINDRGELVSLIENLAPVNGGKLAPASIGPETALRVVIERNYPGFSSANFPQRGVEGNKTDYFGGYLFADELSVTRVAIPMSGGSVQEGFLVVTWDRENVLRHTLVSGSGRILLEENRTNFDSYNIFAIHPGVSSQQIVSGPGTGNLESPSGWVFSSTTIGNNVDAYLDRDNNNAPDTGGRPIDPNANFTTAANLSLIPTTADNQKVAVQNLFYHCNLIHDILYRHGFNEAAGNFQVNNFGNGGSGNDPVNAEAQDGGGTNNANFATPSDGSRPRMQMYLWTYSSPNRDGDLDSDVIYHEYGHGLTWRMIGGMSGPMSGAIGEGMSDVVAIIVNNEDRVGEYSYNNVNGIRSARYSGYTRTYGSFSGSSVHFDGEIYAATIWRLWQLFQSKGVSKDTLLDYLVGGMNFTPSGPAMEDMRDGILTAANSADRCTIWQAFAEFGIGVGAMAQVKGGGPFGGRITITESFAVPSECGGGGGGGGGGGDIVLSVSLSTRGALKANLSWTGGSTANVDIYRNGSVITTTSNSGSYSDNLKNAASGTYTYKVCEAGSTTACSSNESVTVP